MPRPLRSLLLLAVLCVSLASLASAQTIYTSVQNGDYNTPATWDENAVPPSGATVEIASEVTMAENHTVGDITFTTNGFLFIADGDTLSVESGSTVINNQQYPLGAATGHRSGTVHFLGGTGGTTMVSHGTNAILDFFNVIVSHPVDFGTRSLIYGGTMTISPAGEVANNAPRYFAEQRDFFGNITLVFTSTLVYDTGGTFSRGAEWPGGVNNPYPYNAIVEEGTTLNVGDNSTLGDLLVYDSLTVDGTLNFASLGQPFSVGGPVAINGTVDRESAAAAFVAEEDITVASTGSLTLSTNAAAQLQIGGDFNMYGVFNPIGTQTGISTVLFNSTTEPMQYIRGTATSIPFDRIGINNSGGTIQLETGITVADRLTLDNGTLDVNGHTPRLLSTLSGTDLVDLAVITRRNGTVTGGELIYDRYFEATETLNEDGGGVGDWRLIASPFVGVTFESLDNPFCLQGITGGDYQIGDPVLFDYSGGSYVAIGNTTETLAPGQGYLFFPFEEYPADQTACAGEMAPGTWSITGQEYTADITQTLSGPSFHLLGNPYAGHLDWGLTSSPDDHGVINNDGTTAEVATTYQRWNPEPEGAGVSGQGGNYESYNAALGTGQAGRYMPPFEGFWAETTADAAIEFEYGDKNNNSDAEIFGRQPATAAPAPYVTFGLSGAGYVATEFTPLFLDDATDGRDRYDASWLPPLSSGYVAGWLATPSGDRLIYDSRPTPSEFEDVSFDLGVEATQDGTYTLSWTLPDHLPSTWSFQLTDTQTGEIVDLATDADSAYTFTLSAPSATRAPKGGPELLDRYLTDHASFRTAAKAGERFQLTLSSGALPVELAGFSATADGSDVRLGWQTASEDGNAGFEVQARPAEGAAWQTLGFVEGAGTTSEAQRYTYAVEDLPAGTHQFRLRQVDLDGTASYGPVVEASVGVQGAYEVSGVRPNPASGRARLEIAAAEAQHVRVRLYDALGREVAVAFDGELPAAQTEVVSIDTEALGLSAGVYAVVVEGERFQHTERLVVVR